MLSGGGGGGGGGGLRKCTCDSWQRKKVWHGGGGLAMPTTSEHVHEQEVGTHRYQQFWPTLQRPEPLFVPFHFRNIAQLKPIVAKPEVEMTIHASRLDYCNSLSTCPSKSPLGHLYKWSCWLVSSKMTHITLTLPSLQWLPITFRIHFKLLTVTYRYKIKITNGGWAWTLWNAPPMDAIYSQKTRVYLLVGCLVGSLAE